MGGHVAKKLGDGLMALFGYPLAHENDAERAARAALSIQRALKRDPANSAAAEDAFLTAIAIAQQQRARILSCAQLSIWHDFIIPRTVLRTLMLCSRLRSRLFHRPPNFPRSRKRKRFSVCWRHEPIERADAGQRGTAAFARAHGVFSRDASVFVSSRVLHYARALSSLAFEPV
jgi:hypothetical protein